jgi:hypothetical protein
MTQNLPAAHLCCAEAAERQLRRCCGCGWPSLPPTLRRPRPGRRARRARRRRKTGGAPPASPVHRRRAQPPRTRQPKPREGDDSFLPLLSGQSMGTRGGGDGTVLEGRRGDGGGGAEQGIYRPGPLVGRSGSGARRFQRSGSARIATIGGSGADD